MDPAQRVLNRIHPGVYLEHTGPPSWQQRAWAAVLALWPAALCAVSALDRPSATLAQRPRVGRRAWLSAVLVDLAAGTTSVLEHGYRTRIEQAHGLPRAERQVRATGPTGIVYRDVEYAAGLIVELDGRIVHNTVPQRDADFERDLDATVDGRTTARLSWGQVFDRPCSTASRIARLLRQRGWTGTPRPCTAGCPIDAEPVLRLIRCAG